MSARISKISLVVFMLLLVLSAFLLSVAGDNWPWFSVMAVFAIVPIFAGPNRYRIFGAIALLLSLFLIFGDIAAGKHLHQKIKQQSGEAAK
jgi:hypothetical protein